LKRKGVVENIVHERIAVVKLEGLVSLGSTVLDSARKPVGNVTDVIGPVKEPYAVVLLRKGGKGLKKGDIVFFRIGKR
jgi:rRNA processing protein Gar1